MHGKIHRATVTKANLEYQGSITIVLTLSSLQASSRRTRADLQQQ